MPTAFTLEAGKLGFFIGCGDAALCCLDVVEAGCGVSERWWNRRTPAALTTRVIMTATAPRKPRRFPVVPGRVTNVSLAWGDGTVVCAAGAGDSCTSAAGDISCLATSSLAATGGRFKRFLISVADHRRVGSRFTQCFA